MKEIKEIIRAYDLAVDAGKKSALATVVHVEGSSYRRAGARMLVTEDGLITGAISGGCLEGDALRKALLAIHQQKNKLVTYDTTDDDTSLGVQLGCNGIVHILFEPLDPSSSKNALEILRSTQSQRARSVVATIFSFDAAANQYGTVLAKAEESLVLSTLPEMEPIAQMLISDAEEVLRSGLTTTKEYITSGAAAQVSLQAVQPDISLTIFGAGNDAIPLVNVASIAGWNIHVVDGRASHATKQRFPAADQLLVGKPSHILDQLSFDNLSAAVLMTHNYNYDLKVLERLVFTQCPYIGVLGPKKKMEKMYSDLEANGISITDEQRQRIFSPVGLDLGAETSEEIALSIAAEIKAALSGTAATSLRTKDGPIHERSETID